MGKTDGILGAWSTTFLESTKIRQPKTRWALQFDRKKKFHLIGK